MMIKVVQKAICLLVLSLLFPLLISYCYRFFQGIYIDTNLIFIFQMIFSIVSLNYLLNSKDTTK